MIEYSTDGRRGPRRVPDSAHPFPEWRAEYGPRGWSLFSTGGSTGERVVHAVLCANLPVGCARKLGMSEHVFAPVDQFAEVMAERVERLEAHAKVCPACAKTLRDARRLAASH